MTHAALRRSEKHQLTAVSVVPEHSIRDGRQANGATPSVPPFGNLRRERNNAKHNMSFPFQPRQQAGGRTCKWPRAHCNDHGVTALNLLPPSPVKGDPSRAARIKGQLQHTHIRHIHPRTDTIRSDAKNYRRGREAVCRYLETQLDRVRQHDGTERQRVRTDGR